MLINVRVHDTSRSILFNGDARVKVFKAPLFKAEFPRLYQIPYKQYEISRASNVVLLFSGNFILLVRDLI